MAGFGEFLLNSLGETRQAFRPVLECLRPDTREAFRDGVLERRHRPVEDAVPIGEQRQPRFGVCFDIREHELAWCLALPVGLDVAVGAAEALLKLVG